MGMTIGNQVAGIAPFAAAANQSAPSPEITNPQSGPMPVPTPNNTGGAFGKSSAIDAAVNQAIEQTGQPVGGMGGTVNTSTGGYPTPNPAMGGKGGSLYNALNQTPAASGITAQVSLPTQNPVLQKPSFQSSYPTLAGYGTMTSPALSADQRRQAAPQSPGASRPTQNPLIRKPSFQRMGHGRIV